VRYPEIKLAAKLNQGVRIIINKILVIFILLLSNFLHTQLAATEAISEMPEKSISVDIAALEFTGVIQKNGKGLFDLMMKDLAEFSNVSQNYQIYSPARGARMLISGRSDCLIPGSLYPPYYKGMDVIHSESFASVRYLAFTTPEQKTITEKAQLSGKIVGILRDEDTWDYQQRFDLDNAKFVRVTTLEALVEMLYHQRIDVAIHDHSDFISMAEHLSKPKPNFEKNAPMAIDNIVISCHESKTNRAYLKAISPFLQDLIKNNKMKKYSQQTSID